MPLTLTLPRTPSQNGYSETTTSRLQTARFGDGYEQRVVDGINATIMQVQLTLEYLTTAERDTVKTFLDARAGFESFYYTLPSEASPRLWVLEGGLQVSGSQANLWNISFTLKEVFDLA